MNTNRIKTTIILFSAFLLLSSQGFIKTTVALTGNIFNKVNKVGETCNILVFDEDGNRASATRSIGSQNGYYYLPGLKPGKTYEIKLRKKGFMKETITFSIPNSDKYVELSRDFQIKPLRKGIKIPFSVSPFELRKSKLRVGAEIFLEPILNTLEENENVKVKILSYPDSKENPGQNQTITKERAEAVKSWLIKNGIDAARLSTEGSAQVDSDNPPPSEKASKGKRYIGSMYYEIVSF